MSDPNLINGGVPANAPTQYTHVWCASGRDYPCNLTGNQGPDPTGNGQIYIEITSELGTTSVPPEQILTYEDWQAELAAAVQKNNGAAPSATAAPAAAKSATAAAAAAPAAPKANKSTVVQFKPFQPPGHVPDMLRQSRSWIGWRERWDQKTGKIDKLPVCIPDGRGDDFLNPTRHVDYDTAVKAVKRLGLSGVGFVVTKDCGVGGGDLDKCRDPATGAVEPWAQKIIDFGETYIETSPSGKGLRFWFLGALPNGASCIKYGPAGVELYAAGRFLTFSGQHVAGTPQGVQHAPKTLEALIDRVNTARAAGASAGVAKVNIAGQAPPDSDIEAFERWVYQQSPHGKLNQLAIADYAAWVPELFPSAVYYDTEKSCAFTRPIAAVLICRKISASIRTELKTGRFTTWATIATAGARRSTL